MSDREQQGYVVPCYVADEGDPWLHFLHGNVPGHEIDFMYRPEVPQGALSRQHFSHLSRLMKYIEPRHGAEHAFAIGNLSRDDTQHEPGHGGVALIFGLRIKGACDHAGRPDPPFSHAIATVDRALDAGTLFATAAAFHRHVLGEAASAEWYRSYVSAAGEPPESIARILAGYVEGFRDLPRPDPSALSLTWTCGATPPLGRMIILHPDDAPFEDIARVAARIAAVLYRSDVRWSAISTGREADLAHGLSIRLLPESAVSAADTATWRFTFAELPEDEESLARELFGAHPAGRPRASAVSWRGLRPTSNPDVMAEAPRSSTRPVSTPSNDGSPDGSPSPIADNRSLADEPSAVRAAARTHDIADEPTPEVGLEVALAPFAMEDEPTAVPEGDEAPAAKAAALEPAAPVSAPPREDPPAVASAPEKPSPMVPIPVPLPLVSPPPVNEPRSAPPRAAPRTAPGRAAIAGACLVAGIAATLYLVAARDAAPPAEPAASTTPPPAATATPAPIEEHVNPQMTHVNPQMTPASPPAASPPASPPPADAVAPPIAAAKKPARGSQAPSNKLCGVRNGRPCF